jgi:large subunit ribosomal protein L21
MYAIIETGGKQYNVEVGNIIYVEKLDVADDAKVDFDKVLLISGDDNHKIGTPYLNGASVTASVIEHGKEKKVIVYKYKSKKSFHKKKGHRQPFTKLTVDKISS